MASSFSIRAASERTGLSPHVIRAWERRYGAIQPQRSEGRHRLYSEEEIERLAILRRAVEAGHNIGKIARLPLEELRPLVVNHPLPTGGLKVQSTDDPAMAIRAEAMTAIERYDETGLETALRQALVGLGQTGLVRRVVAPLAEETGDRWRSGELTAAQEHFFTAAVKLVMRDLLRQFALPLTAPRLIVGTPAGQLHELGAIMVAATAANLGWRPVYLGPSLPAAEIAGAALRNEAAAVALSIVYPADDPYLAHELTELARLLPPGARLLIGGRAARGYFETLVRIGALYADSLAEFADQLDSLRRRPAAE